VTSIPAPNRRPRPPPRSRNWFGTRALVAACVVAAASLAQAEKADREKPINYSADTGDVNYQTKIGALSGNVVITQGTMTIHADRITFKQNPDNSVSATAYGSPVSFRQKRDGYDEYFEGFAQRAEYDGSKEVLQLFDRALLRRGQDEIRSNYISYNSATEQFKAEGRPDETPAAELQGSGARVRGVFQPKSETPLLPKGKDGKEEPKAGATNPAPAATAPSITLKPAPEITPRPGE
jgi:lipopolysaccharide export system protein LptA